MQVKKVITFIVRGNSSMDKLTEIIVRYTGVPEEVVKDDADLIDDLGADSIVLFEIYGTIEVKYEIEEIPEEVVSRIKTVGDLRKLIRKHTLAI
jgi:acyl carrier protein